jgi:hypothetical protein
MEETSCIPQVRAQSCRCLESGTRIYIWKKCHAFSAVEVLEVCMHTRNVYDGILFLEELVGGGKKNSIKWTSLYKANQ